MSNKQRRPTEFEQTYFVKTQRDKRSYRYVKILLEIKNYSGKSLSKTFLNKEMIN